LDIPGLIERARQDAERVQSITLSYSVPALGDRLDEYYDRLEHYRGRQMIGLRTGMPILDDRLCGVRGFTLLGAAPGGGKSVFGIQVTVGVCRYSVEGDNNACGLILSLDMPASDVTDRLHCHLAGMDWATFRLGSARLRDNTDGPRFTEAH